MYFLLNLSNYVKSYGHLCQFLEFFTMPDLQIWPCHVTQEANFEKILIFPNFAFNTRKSYKTSNGKALYFRSYQPKTSRGGGKHPPPPSAFRVKIKIGRHSRIYNDDANRYEQLPGEKEHVIHVKIKWRMSSISF